MAKNKTQRKIRKLNRIKKRAKKRERVEKNK